MANSPNGLEELVTQAPSFETSQSSRDALQSGDEECPCRCFFWRKNSQRKVMPILPTNSGSFSSDGEAVVPAPEGDKLAAQSCSRSSSSTSPVSAPEEDPTLLVLPGRAPLIDRTEEVAHRPELLPPKVVIPGHLAPQSGHNAGRKTLVLDLDETLIHSSFRVVHTADIIISVELEGEYHRVFVQKRPHVDEFLLKVAQVFEVVVYTASMAKYANPLLDELDRDCVVTFRLFREACTKQPNGYVKDLSKLGRNLKDVIIVDNSPTCYSFQPNNAIPISTWRDDPLDHELMDLVPILYSLKDVEDIPKVLTELVWGQED